MGSQGSKISSRDRAILELKLQRDRLKQYQRRVQTVLDYETNLARRLAQQGDTRRALLALRQKRYQEGVLQSTDNQLRTLEQLTATIEFALIEKDVLHGLSEGNKVLKNIQQEVTMSKVEKIMGDTAEAIAYQNELSELLSSTLSASDEDQILDEFSQMCADVRLPDEELLNSGQIDLPSVPATKLEQSARPEKEPNAEALGPLPAQ